MTDIHIIVTLGFAGLFLVAYLFWRIRLRTTRIECEASSTFSPAYHNEKGWPAIAIEMLPPAGNVRVKQATFTERVIATYRGEKLDDITIAEDVLGGEDIEIVGMQDEVTERSPHPRCKVVLAINKTILQRAKTDLPPGYDPIPAYITVEIGANLLVRPA
jgi:hypothetical protein